MEIMPIVTNEKEAKETKVTKQNRFIGKFVTFALKESSVFATGCRTCVVWCNEDRDGNKIRTLIHSGEILARIVFTDPPQIVVEDYTKVKDFSYQKGRVHRYGAVIRYFLEKFGFPTASEEDLKQFMRKKEVVKETVVKEVEKKPEVAHWVKNCSPRNANDIWYTCSKCGNVADADNNVDILSDFCPHCGASMKADVGGRKEKREESSAVNLTDKNKRHYYSSKDYIGENKFCINGKTYILKVLHKAGEHRNVGKVAEVVDMDGNNVNIVTAIKGYSIIGRTVSNVYMANKRGSLIESTATQLKIA